MLVIGAGACDGQPDGLTDLEPLSGIHRNWRAMLRRGLEAGDLPSEAEEAIEAHQRTGRSWAGEAFLDRPEASTGRRLKRQKPGSKPRTD